MCAVKVASVCSTPSSQKQSLTSPLEWWGYRLARDKTFGGRPELESAPHRSSNLDPRVLAYGGYPVADEHIVNVAIVKQARVQACIQKPAARRRAIDVEHVPNYYLLRTHNV
jgi:crotonobetainyl-CoA:carnitine CoA-transferase CaiB-like acyl-CoA transferase